MVASEVHRREPMPKDIARARSLLCQGSPTIRALVAEAESHHHNGLVMNFYRQGLSHYISKPKPRLAGEPVL